MATSNLKNSKDEKKLKGVEIPLNSDKETIENAIRYQFKYSVIGYVLATVFIMFGVFLLLFGILSPINNISIKLLGLNITVNNATPGIILFFIGSLIIFITKFSVKVKK